MATAEQLKALIRSFADQDEARFYSVAMQMAADAARKGQGRLADELRQLVDDAKRKKSALRTEPGPVPVVRPRGELADLLAASFPEVRLRDMVLPDELRARIERVLREQRQRDRLLEHGLNPRHKLLLVGPPGSGKTMTASALAGELHLPLFSTLLDGLITKFMGETASKLRLIFDAMDNTRAVYFFDEFDAIGGARGAGNDVGEIRRVLNSFLQFLEQDGSGSIIVCATNHPELLDRALFRRFDDVLEYDLPSADEARQLMRNTLASFDTKGLRWAQVVKTAEGLSQAEVVRACMDAAKETVLEKRGRVATATLLDAITERHGAQP